jgi:cyclic beta-1,2-glucan synthetase
MATARLGNGDEAVELFHMLNPINRARSAAGVERYQTEPYVVAADVYAHPAHIGRGGWTWYTGSAAWMYRVGLESILGLRRRGHTFSLAPCVPAAWHAFRLRWRHGQTRYEIAVANPDRRNHGVSLAVLDGQRVDPAAIPLVDDGAVHELQVTMGEPGPAARAPASQGAVPAGGALPR